MRNLLPFVVLSLLTTSARAQVIDFEDLTVPTPPGYYNGSDGAGGFTSRGARFNNTYNPTFGSWSGRAMASSPEIRARHSLRQLGQANTTSRRAGVAPFQSFFPPCGNRHPRQLHCGQ